MSEEGVKFIKYPDDTTTVRIYADEFWGELADLLEDKYGFTIDDIVFSDWRTHCECCGGKFDTEKRMGFARFTDDFMNFCFSVGRRRLEVERRNSGQIPEEAKGYDTVRELFEDNYHNPQQPKQCGSIASDRTTVEDVEGDE